MGFAGLTGYLPTLGWVVALLRKPKLVNPRHHGATPQFLFGTPYDVLHEMLDV